MSCFGKRADLPGGHRRLARREVSLLGSAIALKGSKSVLVEDLCATGAKLLGRQLPAKGEELIIRAGGLDAFGQVAWARGDYRGVIFDPPLPQV